MADNFEKNRQELLNKIERIRHQAKEDQEKEKVVVFGAESTFIDGLVQTIKKKYDVCFFTDADETCAFCLAHETRVVVIDIDPPTDWKMATDVFTGVRTARPETTVIICTKTPSSVPVQTLAAQKAEVLVIPFSVDVLFGKIKAAAERISFISSFLSSPVRCYFTCSVIANRRSIRDVGMRMIIL